MPNISLPPIDNVHRILHIHRNVRGIMQEINTILGNNHINILGQYLKTNDEIGYAVLDVEKKLSRQTVQLLKSIKETIKVRVLY